MSESQPGYQHEDNWYTFLFPDSGVEIAVERVEGTGQIFGNVTIRQQDPNRPYVQTPIRVCLNALRDRQELVRKLVAQEQGNARPWERYLETAFGKVVKTHEQGAPFEDLRQYRPKAGAQDLIRGFLPTRATTLLSGAGGSLKSTLAMALALTVLTGVTVIPGMDLVGQPGAVLYLDWEANKDDLVRRGMSLCDGVSLDWEWLPSPFIYRYMTAKFTGDIRAIRYEVARQDVRLVIVDSMGYAMQHTGQNGGVDGATALMSSLRSLSEGRGGEQDCTRFCIGHVANDDQTKSGRMSTFGSYYQELGARAVWEVRRQSQEAQSEDGVGSVSLGLYNTKANNGPPRKPLGLHVVFRAENEPFKVLRAEIDATDSELSLGLSLAQRITGLLRQEHFLPSFAIAEQLGAKPEEVERTVRRMGDAVIHLNREWTDGNGKKAASVLALRDRQHSA